MKLTFLGTAAANAYPEAFCRCENCNGARALGGRSLRKRSAALINYDLLIDQDPDIMSAAQMHNCLLTNVSYCLQTHAHADHLDPSHFFISQPRFWGCWCANAAFLYLPSIYAKNSPNLRARSIF